MISSLLAGALILGQYTSPTANLVNYVDKADAFSVKIPKEWTSKREQVDQDTFLTNLVGKEKKDGQFDVLTIWFEPELDATATDKMDEVLWPFIKQEIETFGKILSEKVSEGKLDGRKAKRHDFKYETEDKTVYSGYVLISAGKHHVVMTRIHCEESRKDRFKELETYLKTFAIESKSPRNPVLDTKPD